MSQRNSAVALNVRTHPAHVRHGFNKVETHELILTSRHRVRLSGCIYMYMYIVVYDEDSGSVPGEEGLTTAKKPGMGRLGRWGHDLLGGWQQS